MGQHQQIKITSTCICCPELRANIIEVLPHHHSYIIISLAQESKFDCFIGQQMGYAWVELCNGRVIPLGDYISPNSYFVCRCGVVRGNELSLDGMDSPEKRRLTFLAWIHQRPMYHCCPAKVGYRLQLVVPSKLSGKSVMETYIVVDLVFTYQRQLHWQRWATECHHSIRGWN